MNMKPVDTLFWPCCLTCLYAVCIVWDGCGCDAEKIDDVTFGCLNGMRLGYVIDCV